MSHAYKRWAEDGRIRGKRQDAHKGACLKAGDEQAQAKLDLFRQLAAPTSGDIGQKARQVHIAFPPQESPRQIVYLFIDAGETIGPRTENHPKRLEADQPFCRNVAMALRRQNGLGWCLRIAVDAPCRPRRQARSYVEEGPYEQGSRASFHGSTQLPERHRPRCRRRRRGGTRRRRAGFQSAEGAGASAASSTGSDAAGAVAPGDTVGGTTAARIGSAPCPRSPTTR